MARTNCRSKQALLRGLRPNPSQKTQCGVCSSRCIYCDIWKLATLVSSHVPLSSSVKLQRRTSHSSTSSNDSFDWERSERVLEAQFQTQRVRLASIMSICTVDGAEESEGLRIAHDRCLGSVTDLMVQEQVIEQRAGARTRPSKSSREPSSLSPPNMARRSSKGCASSQYYYPDQQRPNMVAI